MFIGSSAPRRASEERSTRWLAYLYGLVCRVREVSLPLPVKLNFHIEASSPAF